MNKKLRPMRVNSNQIARILKGEIGHGFFVYRFDDKQVEVVEFSVSALGDLLRGDGLPLQYYCKNGKTFKYGIVKEEIKSPDIEQ